MKSVTILGASGSIGSNALAFLRLHRDRFSIKAVSFAKSWESAVAIYREFTPEVVAFSDTFAANAFFKAIDGDCHVIAGPNAAAEVASISVDVVLAAISGSVGFPSVHAAVKSGNRVALANKEALVCGGTKLLSLAKERGSEVIPVDSEHSAIYQCVKLGRRDEIRRLVLTASGGPFRDWTKAQIVSATVDQALKHPTWKMGPKNSLDSATLANKGLELIEACYFFDMPSTHIDVFVNPSSLLHSAVSYIDGTMIALLGHNDMKNAIGYALSYPDRLHTGVGDLNLGEVHSLEFRSVNPENFPCLTLARQAVNAGAGATMMFNAANEIAGRMFMEGRIGFYKISEIISESLSCDTSKFDVKLDDLMAADQEAKSLASKVANDLILARI